MQLRHLALAVLVAVPACKGSGDASTSVARAPSSSGEVWEVDSAAIRSAAPGALTAFVNGVHVILIDGDHAYAGTQSLAIRKTDDGQRTLQLADGSTAQLLPSGDALDLRFAGGEHVMLRRQPARSGTP